MDAALEALFWPFDIGELTPAGPVLFLRARAGAALTRCCAAYPDLRVDCEQSFRPYADELERAGVALKSDPGGYATVLVLPPRQRAEARALLVEAFARAAPGGLVAVSVANNEGARSLEKDMGELVADVESRSKHKCRVFFARATPMNDTLAESWRAADAPQRVCDGRFWSRPGVFAWDHIDLASALLTETLPTDLSGHGADLGSGFGYLAHEVLARSPHVTALDLYEAEARALEMAKRNIVTSAKVAFYWHDVTRGLRNTYDFVVTNPPFHQGHADVPQLGRAFIIAAATALRAGGRLFLVANRHLPYEATLSEHFALVHKRADRNGFKVLEAVKA